MTHPTDLFADFVDGTLPADQRQAVSAHLESCSTCRAEVALALEAREALAALPEEPIPLGTTRDVVRRAKPPRRTASPRVYRVAALAAAASIIAFGGFLALRETNRESVTALSGEAAAPASSPADLEPGPFDRDGDYDSSELVALAGKTAKHSGAAERKAPSGDLTAAPGTTANKQLAAGEAAGVDVGKATRCLKKGGAFGHGGQLIGVFEAKYQGKPAVFGVLLEGPEAGAAHDRAVVWVVSRSNCEVIAFAQQKFPGVSPSPSVPASSAIP